MTKHVVQMDDRDQRMVRELTDPIEVHTATFEWLFRQLPLSVMVVEGPIDIQNQTIKGIRIRDIYARNDALREGAHAQTIR